MAVAFPGKKQEGQQRHEKLGEGWVPKRQYVVRDSEKLLLHLRAHRKSSDYVYKILTTLFIVPTSSIIMFQIA